MLKQNKLSQSIETIDDLIKRGELIKAYNLAISNIAQHPSSPLLKHRAVLCLVNSGALSAASQEFVKLELDKIVDDEEILCLKGKILKSQALTDKSIARLATEQYAKAYALNKNFYPGINLATLQLLCGDKTSSQTTAAEVLSSINCVSSDDTDNPYYKYATKAEAYLLLDQVSKVKTYLSKAITQDPANYRAHATTIKQLELITKVQEKSSRWLNNFRPPIAIHYGGYIFSPSGGHNNISETDLISLESKVTTRLKHMNVGFGYGSLAAGSDIIIAETILSLGAELNVVLPTDTIDFIAQSVTPFGQEWVERFHSCLKRATSVQISSLNLTLLDETLLKFSSQVAMGRTILRAQTLATKAQQLLIWSGAEGDKISITYSDYKFWEKTGFEQEQILLTNLAPNKEGAKKISDLNNNKHKRTIAAILFADFHKFSELNEGQVSIFSEHILKLLSETLKQSDIKPFEMNTWGDGLFLAFESVVDAANCGSVLQKCFNKIDLAKLGLPKNLSLRIGANYGPVFSGIDAFLEKPTVFGPNVTFAARIEPITVPGSIYVSENFASVLATQPNTKYRCEYIGLVKLHKSNEPTPIYSIHHR